MSILRLIWPGLIGCAMAGLATAIVATPMDGLFSAVGGSVILWIIAFIVRWWLTREGHK